jgi:predicted P-loop ATPase
MTISFYDRVRVPDDVLISNLQDESVILNLNNERYYGLDSVGTRILSVLTTSESIEAAYNMLVQEYDIEGDVLRQDLIALVENLVEQGLVEISQRSSPMSADQRSNPC